MLMLSVRKLCEQESIPVGSVPPAGPAYVASHQMSAPVGSLDDEVLKLTFIQSWPPDVCWQAVIKLRRKVPHSAPTPTPHPTPNVDHYVPKHTIHIFHSYVRSALFYQTLHTH